MFWRSVGTICGRSATGNSRGADFRKFYSKKSQDCRKWVFPSPRSSIGNTLPINGMFPNFPFLMDIHSWCPHESWQYSLSEFWRNSVFWSIVENSIYAERHQIVAPKSNQIAGNFSFQTYGTASKLKYDASEFLSRILHKTWAYIYWMLL